MRLLEELDRPDTSPTKILEKLGAGGVGEVHRARDTKLGRDMAIKRLPEAFARDPERIARFEREAGTPRRLWRTTGNTRERLIRGQVPYRKD